MLVAEALLLPRHSRGFIWLLPTKKALPQQCFFVAEMGEYHSGTQQVLPPLEGNIIAQKSIIQQYSLH